MIPPLITGSTSDYTDLEDYTDSAKKRNVPDPTIYSEKETIPENDCVDQ
jgi:hypothetical protein